MVDDPDGGHVMPIRGCTAGRSAGRPVAQTGRDQVALDVMDLTDQRDALAARIH
jgi:hypothetical protein